MDESEVLRFEQQKQITKLSQAIREGKKHVEENWKSHNHCALGMACHTYTGKRLRDCVAFRGSDGNKPGSYHQFIADLSGVPALVVRDAEWKHISGMPALAIADELEAMGY